MDDTNNGFFSGLLGGSPGPSEEEIAKMRSEVEKLKRGGAGGYGLLGPSDEELARMRQQQGIPDAEPPSP